jgi:tight adherence protein C
MPPGLPPGAVERLVWCLVATFLIVAVRRHASTCRRRAHVRARLRAATGSNRSPGAGAGPDAGTGTGARLGRAVGSAADRVAAAVGRELRARARRPLDPVADRRLGWATVTGATAAPVVGLPAAAALAVVVGGVPAARARATRRRRSAAVIADIPDVIDLLRLAMESGLDVGNALAAVVDHGDGTGAVGVALRRVRRRMARGDRLVDALTELEPLGEPARSLHESLVATHRHGVPLGPALERAGADARDIRRRHREAAARALPVKLLFPLVFCTLPALVVLTVVPLLVRSFPSLTP